MDQRLVTPESAAAYLGLGSRWAVYRLIGSGALQAVKIAGKIRIDRRDLDALIEASKGTTAVPPLARTPARRFPASRLAPLARRRKVQNGDRMVTPAAQHRPSAERPLAASVVHSVATKLRLTP